MMLEIPGVLDKPTLAAVQKVANNDNLFSSGQASAGWHARDRKHNLQASGGLTQGLLEKVEQVVMQNELVRAAAQPKALVKLILSRYDPGMYYGRHVDDALMNGQRTDLSFSLFIAPPESYEGGALVIDEPAGERYVKLSAGSLFLYPSSSLHRVEEVTRGKRLVVVGWLSSYVRSACQREILFDLERSIHALRNGGSESGETLPLLLKTRSNLLRLWAET